MRGPGFIDELRVFGKAHMVRRMPVPRINHCIKGIYQPVDYRNNLVAAGNPQGAAGAKIILEIHNNQSFSHQTIPPAKQASEKTCLCLLYISLQQGITLQNSL